MTPPTLSMEVREFFREREDNTYYEYQSYLRNLLPSDIQGWHEARDLRHIWQQAHADWKRSLAAVPCTHRLVERQHTAQRCEYCWMLSTYSRSQEEIDDDQG